MSAIVVDHQMQSFVGELAIHAPEKLQVLLMPVALVKVANDFALRYIQRGKQSGGPVAFVVMSHGSTAALLQRKPWLGAV